MIDVSSEANNNSTELMELIRKLRMNKPMATAQFTEQNFDIHPNVFKITTLKIQFVFKN